MVMRVGGIVSGMDIEGMVDKLMEAERIPLSRMEQERTLLEWKRDGYREINRALLEVEEMMLDMKLSRTYNPKSVTSSQAGAVTATASSTATNGSYEINVSRLAENEMQVGKVSEEIGLHDELPDNLHGDHTFYTYNEEADEDESFKNKYTVHIKKGDTLNSVLQKITRDDNNVRAFFDESSNQVVFETTRTGVYNTDENGDRNGNEIEFGEEADELFVKLGLANSGETEMKPTIKQAQDAKFTYNNELEITSKNNHYTINGINLEFHNVTDENARLTVSTDVDEAFDKITTFVDKYNKVIELMNTSQSEQKKYDYHPLSDEEKEDMTEEQIEKWEEQAKSGILRGEASIQNGMFTMRQGWYSKVDTDGEYSVLSQIGITTSKDYLNGGQLTIDEDKLKSALQENPDDVYKLFSNSSEGDSRGLIHRLEDSLKSTKENIERQAGRESNTGLDGYSIGRRMKDLNSRISDFEAKMVRIEERYWSQFTQMEKAISQFNNQASHLFSEFGGGM